MCIRDRLEIVYWFNPLVRLMMNQLRLDLEYFIDEKLLEDKPQADRIGYARLLLALSADPVSYTHLDSDTIFQIFKVIMKITNGITNIWIGSWVTNRPVAVSYTHLKCSEPQVVSSDVKGEGSGVAKSSRLRTET